MRKRTGTFNAMKRPIVLTSVTQSDDPDVTHLPLLGTRFFSPAVDLSRYDGIILTSKQGVEAIERIDPAWKSLDVLCVGKATENKIVSLGAKILERSDGYGAGLYDIVKRRHAGRRWLYARPKVVASDFAQRLRNDGITVDEVVVYETVCEDGGETPPKNAVLIFTSPSALKCFEKRFAIVPTQDVVVIGRTTAQAARTHAHVHMAPEPSVRACVALAKHIAKRSIA